MGRYLTQKQIEEASIAMEASMELSELQESLRNVRENLEYLNTYAKSVDLSIYRKLVAAELAAVNAIERIINSERSNGQSLPQKAKASTLRVMSFRKGIGQPCQERSKAFLRLVRGRRRG
jgi:hypothetical protein